MKKIDILVAVRNESENIRKFVDQINKINIDGIDISIVFLEDGSTDDTLNVLRTLAKEFNFVKFYSLKNDLGQYIALFFGINESTADAVIIMDVDGGHPVYIIEGMIREYLNGYNVVQGHREHYKQKAKYRAIASYLYNLFFLVFVGLNILKQNSIFRLMDRKACEIFKANFHWGYSLKTNFKKSDKIKIIYTSYDTPEREFGVSKYNFFRLANLSIRVAYSQLSKQRFILLSLIFLSFTIISFINNNYVDFVLSILLMALVTIPYLLLTKTNPVSQIKILESD
jgi:polyisoprenyl-phosphate glycosyltransferase